jgi:hypothetical protein
LERAVKNSKMQSAVLLLFTLCLLTGAYGQITPNADAYTDSTDPNTNYGAAALLDVDGATQATYIQFDLSSIPTGAVVSQATLKLYVNAVTTAGNFEVYSVNGTWSESTITSNLAPALGSVIDSSVSITNADQNQYILANITSTVQGWVDTPSSNNGIALVAIGTFNANFDSKESTTTSHPPELDVVFAGDGTITGVTTASGSGLIGGGTSGTLNLSLTNACAANQVLQWNGSLWVCASIGAGTVTSVNGTTDEIASTGGTTPVLSIPRLFVAPGSISFAGQGSASSPVICTPTGCGSEGGQGGIHWSDPGFFIAEAGVDYYEFGNLKNGGLEIASTIPINFATNIDDTNGDTTISRDASHVIAIGSGGTPPTVGDETGFVRDANTCRITSAHTLSTSATIVCSWSLPATAFTWAWNCEIPYTVTAGTSTALTLGMNPSQTPTNVTGYANIYSSNAGAASEGNASATTSGNTNILTGGTVANGTFLAFTFGTIQASSKAGTFAITATLSGAGGPTGTIPVGGVCTLQ